MLIAAGAIAISVMLLPGISGSRRTNNIVKQFRMAVAMVTGLLIPGYDAPVSDRPSITGLWAGARALGLWCLSLVDDFHPLPAKVKLLAQIGIIATAVYFGDLRIDHFLSGITKNIGKVYGHFPCVELCVKNVPKSATMGKNGECLFVEKPTSYRN